MSDLAHKLVTRPEWRWWPGMRSLDDDGYGARWVASHSSGGGLVHDDRALDRLLPVSPGFARLARPCLDDPATVGCLLAMLPPNRWTVTPAVGGGWTVETRGQVHGGPTLGEAVARALISVWEAA